MKNPNVLQDVLRERRQPVVIKAAKEITLFDIPRTLGISQKSIDGAPPAGEPYEEGPFNLNFSRHDPLLTSIRRLLVFTDESGQNQIVNVAYGYCVLNKKEHTATFVQPPQQGEVLTYTLSRFGVQISKMDDASPEDLKRAAGMARRNLAAIHVATDVADRDGFDYKRRG